MKGRPPGAKDKTLRRRTARLYPCGCLIRAFKPRLVWVACRRHHLELESGIIRNYEQAIRYIEKELGPDFEKVAPPRRDERNKVRRKKR